MKILYRYNWQVRNEWFQWCGQFPHEELTSPRTGGLGSILETLFHIVDVEQAWINGLRGEPEFHYNYADYSSLGKVKKLSAQCRPTIIKFVEEWNSELDSKLIDDFTYREVMNHVIAHEIHHIGQLSVWARELETRPISANLIGRGVVE
ncbi:DinB family protein [Alteribacter populi]|uniref:DinB family protein n=1 Tax=Alteribacter populi TaxID=2011011 RepID=UPI000BBA5E53|nr:DinB family protein [Alteribacter populi]